MKKFLIVLLSFICTVTVLAGCSTGEISSTDTSSPSAEESGEPINSVSADGKAETSSNLERLASINVKADGSNFQYWNEDSEVLKTLKAYVEDVTNPDSPNYIPEEYRIAVSDMDGTFYGELAPTYSEWALYFHRIFDDPDYTPTDAELAYAEECLAAAKAGSISADMDAGEDMAQSYAFEGMSLEEFEAYAEDFLTSTPLDGLTDCTYAEAYYLPMVEVITYLQNNGFDFYVVTATDRQLVRVAVRNAIPSIRANHIIGTDSLCIAARQGFADSLYFVYGEESGDTLVRGSYQSTNNKMAKVQSIVKEIGICPVLAFGNSSSDASMLNYTLSNPDYPSLAFGICCDDSVRDWGSEEKGNKFKATCETYGWIPVSMANDWKTIYGDNVLKTEEKEFTKSGS